MVNLASIDVLSQHWFNSFGLAGIALILFLCTYGFPFSKNLIIIACGVMAAHGFIQPLTAIGVCIGGMFTGDFSLFSAAKYARTKFGAFLIKFVNHKRFTKANDLFNRYGLYPSIFLARFLPYVRSPLYVNAGIQRMSFIAFIFLDLLSLVLYIPLLFWLGFKGADISKNTFTIPWGDTTFIVLLLTLSFLIILISIGLFFRKDIKHSEI